jgi:integrase
VRGETATARAARRAAYTLAQRDITMFLLAYFTYLRTSEVARMTVADITFTEERSPTRARSAPTVTVMRVHVDRLSKNDKDRKGHERLVEAKEKSRICTVGRMQRYLASLAADQRLLFVTERGGTMSCDTPRSRLRHWLTVIGVTDPMVYGFHSMRSGAATAAATAGVKDRHIQAHGNWRSDAFKGYIRANTEARLTVSRALGQ